MGLAGATRIHTARLTFLLLPFLLSHACSGPSVSQPPRPEGVALGAAWAGGVDGGAWIHCESHRPTSDRLACTVWLDSTGKLWATGTFVLRRCRSDIDSRLRLCSKESELDDGTAYTGFDGVEIDLTGDLVLLPDGWIDYPLQEGRGKRYEYVEGQPIGQGIEYSEPS